MQKFFCQLGSFSRTGTLVLVSSLIPVLTAGCSGPGAQISRCQQEKDELLAAIKSERSKSQDLAERSQALEARLDQSEKQVAMLTGNGNTRWAQNNPPSRSSTSESASGVPSRTASSSTLASDGELKWKAGKGASTAPGVKKDALVLSGPRGSSQVVSEPSGSELAQLARLDRRLQYDPQSGMAKFKASVAFEGNQTALTESSRHQLNELSQFLKNGDKNNLRIMVVGKPNGAEGTKTKARELGLARAQAVADYLDRHGIASERLAVTGVGMGKAVSPDAAALESPVEIFLVEPGASIAGWDDISRQKR